MARHDNLLAALIAKLPAKSEPWRRDERIAWLRMMAMAFDVVYGGCGGVAVTPAAPDDGAAIPADIEDKSASAPVRRYYVDRDGFAMGDGRPIAMDELPTPAVLWDERAGIESGDVGAILWRDVGATRKSLPAGVTLKSAIEPA